MQNQQQNFHDSSQMQPQQNFGGHELLDLHEVLGDLVAGLEQYLLYEQHIQDQALTSILKHHQTFLTQLYNTIVNTLKTGQDPAVPTQTYNMTQNNDIVYGMQPSAPKSPSQSVNELTDECISGFMLGVLKTNATGFTTAALESNNPVLRRILSDSIPNIIEMAYEVFLYQNKHQYYQVPQLQAQDMQILTNSFAPANMTKTH